MSEATAKKEETREKAFIRLMMLGKIGPAAKYINNDDNIKGVHPLTNEIKDILQSKHPDGRDIDPGVVYDYTAEPPQPVIYEAFTVDKVQKIAKNMNGSGGPTLIDSDTWKDILFQSIRQQLCRSMPINSRFGQTIVHRKYTCGLSS